MDSCDTERLIVHPDQDGCREWSLRQRKSPNVHKGSIVTGGSFSYEEWNHSMTFDGRVFLSKYYAEYKGLGFLIGLQILGLFLCATALYFCYFHFQLFHYHVTGLYAGLGHADAQHLMGDKFLHGKGVAKDENLAMEWYSKAAAQGHPHSSYNLAIGHLSGMKTQLGPGQAHKLIQHAAENGVKLAKDVLVHVCKHQGCE